MKLSNKAIVWTAYPIVCLAVLWLIILRFESHAKYAYLIAALVAFIVTFPLDIYLKTKAKEAEILAAQKKNKFKKFSTPDSVTNPSKKETLIRRNINSKIKSE